MKNKNTFRVASPVPSSIWKKVMEEVKKNKK